MKEMMMAWGSAEIGIDWVQSRGGGGVGEKHKQPGFKVVSEGSRTRSAPSS